MNKPTKLQAIQTLHKQGQLETAKAGYLRILKKEPRNSEVLHSLGILCAQQDQFNEAQKYLELAHQMQPNNQTILLHLANVLKFQGLLAKAAELLEKAIHKEPNFIPALNNLGTIYFSQGKLGQAISSYKKAISLQPNYVDAYYNLGLAYSKNNDLLNATVTFQQLLLLAPEHFAARFHLACLRLKQNKIDEAIEKFLEIEKAHPDHLETQSNLATAYLKKGLLNEAKQHYMNALDINKEDLQSLFNLGVINMQLGSVDAAIRYYQQAVQSHPDDFALHNNLGVAYISKQHVGFALDHFKEALRLQPNNIAIQHTVDFLSKNQYLLTSPPDYVKSLFDAYADHYDAHLLKALEFALPAIFISTLTKATHLKPSTTILDLGCGTGLIGEALKPFTQEIVGVDLSPKMLEMAEQKHIYQKLICDDITHFLTKTSSVYDIVLAGDVLVYLGDLNSLFKSVHKVLHPGGLFLFNTEISDDKEFKMTQSGRFAHHKKYLEELADSHHFNIISYQKMMTRMQNNEPVYGHIFLLQKKSQ